MRNLMSTTILTPLAVVLLPAAASAQVTISTATTTPVSTSTVDAGNPADIEVTADGSITLNSGAAITVDSDNNVSNAGTLTQGNANGAVGIDVLSGTSATITNSGTISITETFNAPHADGSTIVNGPIAQATDRNGIWVHGGGTHSGDILQSGTVTIEGLNSAGVRIDDTLSGNYLQAGTTTVRGDNGVALQTGAVTGNVVVGGAISVIGRGASAINITGDVGGMVRLENAIGQAASFTDDNGTTLYLSADDLRANAPTVAIGGNVGGGIIVASAPTTSTTNPDTDNDGIPDANESAGSIQSYGNGAALLVGSANNITVSPVASDTHGIVIAGTVNGNGYYANTDATGIQIGGLGGTVTVDGGISVTGAVTATTSAITTGAGAAAILINSGASVPVLDNSGSIRASISSPGEGATYGIRDLSGSLATVNNSGTITVSGTSQDAAYAIDLSANTSGATINQVAPATGSTVTPTISGAIRTGSGNDMFAISAGNVVSATNLGAGDDTLALSGDATYVGTVDFGTGAATMSLAGTSRFGGTANFQDQAATLTIADTGLYKGAITGGSNLAVAVNGGTLEASGTSDLAFSTLTVGAAGTLKVDIDTANGTNPKFDVGTATFESGASVAATVNSIANAEGSYVVLTANQINGAPAFSSDQTLLPFLFTGSVAVDNTAQNLVLTIARKSAADLGLNRSETAAYSGILAAAPADSQLQQSLLEASDAASLKSQFDMLLPDHAGGNFDVLVRGSRLAAQHLSNNNSMFDISNVGGWFEILRTTGGKDEGQTQGYDTRTWGLSGGIERVTGIGNIGLTINYMSGKNQNPANSNSVSTTNTEFGLFWRMSKGPFYVFARGALGLPSFKGSRTFISTANSTAFGRRATANWKGKLYSGIGGMSYEFDVSDRLAFKPMAIVDYYRLHENSYMETGGAVATDADAIDLLVAGHTSIVSTAKTTLTGIYRFGPRSAEGIPLTFELEGGRRNIIKSDIGPVAANFVNGASFSLTPEQRQGAWLGEARLLSGGLDYTWTLAAGAEQTSANVGYHVRFSLGVAF